MPKTTAPIPAQAAKASETTETAIIATLPGLSSAQVQELTAEGKINKDTSVKTRTFGQIARDNICTLFNLVNVVLAALVFLTGSYKNMLFMFIIAANVIIGIVQEIRSKRLTDKLAIVVAASVQAVRNGELTTIAVTDIVLGDVIRLARGDQVPADCTVLHGACKANESLLTGESRLIPKQEQSQLMSGSFIASGVVFARVTSVGADNYAAQLTAQAKEHKAINSEIMRSVNGIVKYVSIALFPVGALLFASQFFLQDLPWRAAVLSTTSALVGMIPEGLILLTSMVLAVAVIRLARVKVLVQQLYCIETLARVDVLCLDKTGTITTGHMKVRAITDTAGGSEGADAAQKAVRAIAAADNDPNDTARALQAYFASQPSAPAAAAASAAAPAAAKAPAPPTPTEGARFIPFSSETKLSGVVLPTGTAYCMGAAPFVLANHAAELARIQPTADKLANDARVLLVARVQGFTAEGAPSGTVEPLGFVLLEDEIRQTAPQTIRYFMEQGVELKVISGDDPHTVSAIAARVGVPDAEKFVDCSTLTTEAAIQQAIHENSVFGRVRPEQKKAFVQALQQAGHTVAMTGDGVNDVLALKAADCSVAMASGSDAARNVAQLVLVNNDFASMPEVVAEGRRSINNLQRSASLFLVKTIFSIFLAVAFILLPWQYPFMPIQMTLISAFTIGLPSFVLALEPNHERVRGHFLRNCISKSVPGALCVIASILACSIIGYEVLALSYAEVSTMCVMLTSLIGLMLVIRLSVPFTLIRAGMMLISVAGLTLGCSFFAPLFTISPLSAPALQLLLITAGIILVAYQLLFTLFSKIRFSHEGHQ